MIGVPEGLFGNREMAASGEPPEVPAQRAEGRKRRAPTDAATLDHEVPWSGRPELAGHVRLRFDQARGRHVLLGPESVTVLNRTAADVLDLCDGQRTVDEIVIELRKRYTGVVGDDVRIFLARLAGKRDVEISHG